MTASEACRTRLSLALVEYLEARVSERMRRIVDYTLEARPTWDLCCDHGLIGLWAYRKRDVPEVHLVDRTTLLMEELEKRVQCHVANPRISIHNIDAAEISLGDTPCNLILAGVGFRAARRILSAIDLGHAAHRAVVSVHAESERLPDAMNQLGWRLVDECTVTENGRDREISAWDRD